MFLYFLAILNCSCAFWGYGGKNIRECLWEEHTHCVMEKLKIIILYMLALSSSSTLPPSGLRSPSLPTLMTSGSVGLRQETLIEGLLCAGHRAGPEMERQVSHGAFRPLVHLGRRADGGPAWATGREYIPEGALGPTQAFGPRDMEDSYLVRDLGGGGTQPGDGTWEERSRGQREWCERGGNRNSSITHGRRSPATVAGMHGGLGRARCTLRSSGLARPGIGNPRGCHAEGVVCLFGDSVVGQVSGFRVRAQRQELDLEAPVGGPNLSRSSVCRPGFSADSGAFGGEGVQGRGGLQGDSRGPCFVLACCAHLRVHRVLPSARARSVQCASSSVWLCCTLSEQRGCHWLCEVPRVGLLGATLLLRDGPWDHTGPADILPY